MTDTPPDRIAAHPSSPHYNADALERGLACALRAPSAPMLTNIAFPKGWIRVALGKKVDRKGAPLTIKLNGPVEVWYKDETKAAD